MPESYTTARFKAAAESALRHLDDSVLDLLIFTLEAHVTMKQARSEGGDSKNTGLRLVKGQNPVKQARR